MIHNKCYFFQTTIISFSSKFINSLEHCSRNIFNRVAKSPSSNWRKGNWWNTLFFSLAQTRFNEFPKSLQIKKRLNILYNLLDMLQIYCRYKIYFGQHVSRITFIRYAQIWKIGKPYNLKVFGSNKIKGTKQNSQNCLRSHIFNLLIITIVNFNNKQTMPVPKHWLLGT